MEKKKKENEEKEEVEKNKKKEKGEVEKKKMEKEEREEVERKEQEEREREMVKKEKKEEEGAKQKAQVVPKEKKKVEEVGKEVVIPEKEVKQQGIEAVISSVEAITPLDSVSFSFLFLCPSYYTLVYLFTYNFLLQAQPMLEDHGDIDSLLKVVSLTLQQCQTPTKTSSTITALKPTQEQLQAAINQLKEPLKQPTNVILFYAGLVDQFQQVARFLIANPSSLSESGKALLGLFFSKP